MDDLRDRYRLPNHTPQQPARRLMPTAPARPATSRPEPSGPLPHQPRAVQPRRRFSKRQVLKTAITLVILAVLAGGAVYVYPKFFAKNPFPVRIRQNAGIRLYYPTRLPAAYMVDSNSYQQSNGITIFSADNHDRRLVFSEQKKAPTFNYDAFYKQALQESQRFSTAYGQAAVGKTDGHYLGSLVAGDTWIILSTNTADVSTNDFRYVLSNLQKY